MTNPTARRIVRTPASAITPRGAAPETWGPWRLKRSTNELVRTDPHGHRYHVDLDRMTPPAQVLDWLAHVSAKLWADDATTAGLVRALRDLGPPAMKGAY